ncbi:TetR/AcrR family transcriptional regulator [Gluconacetobacter sacchari]|uniref:TetR/AcrR family transcriptional regulator n=1 Tax=Gluconacetobacter sacchari TaxID=92759 RepID=UPI0039B42BD8
MHAADIAAEAGVTQRTFFRHFPDKREVLFGGEDVFIAALTNAVSDAPAALRPWEVLLRACRSVEPLFVENRALSASRRVIIAAHPTLQERAETKTRAVMAALTAALRARHRGSHGRSPHPTGHDGHGSRGRRQTPGGRTA